MSKLKRTASILLALVMVLALNVTVLAADTYTITINYSQSGHTYEAYQIFTGTLGKYEEYTGTEAPTDGTQLYTYDNSSDTYTEANYDATATTTYYTFTKVLSDVDWGNGVNGGDLLTALKNSSVEINTDSGTTTVETLFKNCTTAAEVADVLSTNNTNEELAEAFAQIASEHTTTVAGTSSYKEGTSYTYTITGLEAGYYLVKDQDNSVTGEGDSYTDIILEVVSNVTVSAKASTTTFDKKVASTTDTSKETSADYSIGDDVPFTLTATLPSNYDDYNEYILIFHDTLSDGLSFNNEVVVTVYADSSDTAGTVVNSGYAVTTECYHAVSISAFADGTTYYTYDGNDYIVATDNYDSNTDYYVKCSLAVQIDDTNALKDENGAEINVTGDSIIVVTYTAKLLDSAGTTETNTAYTEYSNNPNDSGTGKTTEDKTTVITFTLDVDKVTESGAALEGAGFTLYKETTLTAFESGVTYYAYNDDGEMTEVSDTTGAPESAKIYYVLVDTVTTGQYKEAANLTEFKTGVTYYTYDSTNGYEEVTDTSGTPDVNITYYVKNNYTFDGLGIGKYVLVESTTPTGYNTMDDLYFTIEATTAEDKYGNGYVESLTIRDADGNVISTGTEPSFVVDASTKTTISTSIRNYAGSMLPSTGGIGTTIFYIVGGVMVVGAVVLFITRRRMRKGA